MSKSLKRVFAFILGVLLTLGFQLGNPVQAGGPDAQGEAVGLKSDDAGWYFGHPGGWPEGPFATAESCEASRALVGGLPCVYWGGSGSTITEKVGLKSSWAMVSKQGTTVNLYTNEEDCLKAIPAYERNQPAGSPWSCSPA